MKQKHALLSIVAVCILLLPGLCVGETLSATALPQQARQTLLAHQTRHPLGRQSPTPVIPLGLYHSYQQMTNLLFSLAANHSDIMRVTSLGKTYEGRDLWLVKISDNVNMQEDEPEVLFTGAHHGNEKIGYEVLIYFIEYMVRYYHNTSAVKNAIDTTQIYVIPMVNPDGVEAVTRKNKEPNHGWFGHRKTVTSIGVDLNRNYEGHWPLLFFRPRFYSSTSFIDTNEVYRGPYPFSENETKAIKKFVETHNISISIDYHSFSELVLYPWGYRILPAKDYLLLDSIAENISDINHYKYEQSIYLYPTLGDTCDWLYEYHHVLAFTIELGTSYAPENPAVVHTLCVEHTNVNLYICQRAQSLLKRT